MARFVRSQTGNEKRGGGDSGPQSKPNNGNHQKSGKRYQRSPFEFKPDFVPRKIQDCYPLAALNEMCSKLLRLGQFTHYLFVPKSIMHAKLSSASQQKLSAGI
jgi:hypothetical protein